VQAFWSVTMDDGTTQLLINKPPQPLLINSSLLPHLQQNPDSSLTIYLPQNSPGPNREANWLPAPNGPIYLVLRLYWPRTEPPSIPPGEGTWEPPVVKGVK
jgi:hypothetical protein